MDRQEVGRVAEFLDQVQLVLQCPDDLVGNAFGIAPSRAFPGQPCQGLLRGEAGFAGLVGILVGEIVEAEANAPGDLDRARDRLGPAREQARHLLGPLQMAVGVALAPEAGIVDRNALADAGDDILQDAALGAVEQHVVGRDGRDPHRRRHVRQLMQPKLVPRPAAQ